MPVDVLIAGMHALIVAALLTAGFPAVARSGPEPPALAASVSEPATSLARLRAVIAVVCGVGDPPPPAALTLPLGGAIELSREPLRRRDRVMGTRHLLMLPDGARIRLDRIGTDGVLRRVVASYDEPTGAGRRPALLAVADGGCNVMGGRRIAYYADGMPRSVEFLPGGMDRAVRVEPLNPPVPAAPTSARLDMVPRLGDVMSNPPAPAAPTSAAEGPRVRVALVDSGVNYLLPEIASRLARDEDGALVGFDFQDLDARPFDADPARSAFHPRRHGTRTASLLLEEAPVAVLVPYRYPRRDMSRMPDLVEHAAAAGVRIMNISMGSRRRSEWAGFEAAARAHPAILFVVSAGNDDADIDEKPVYPASLPLDNLLTVTSSDRSGLPARGSNRGRRSVDLAVPAEQVPVTGFHGRVREVSGSSYAAARVSALAACLLAAHPEWTAPELKSAILARAEKPASEMVAYVGAGTLHDPIGADRGACAARPSTVTEIPSGTWTAEHLYPAPSEESTSSPLEQSGTWTPEHLHATGTEPPGGYAIGLDIVILSGAGWRIAEIHRAVRRAAGILAQCEVLVARARVRTVEAPRRYRYLHDSWSRRLARRLDPARPAVFFVEETLRQPAFEAEAFGQGNTRRMPALRDTVWITRAARDVGIVLAHELFHVLADLGRHETDPGNLMNERIGAHSTGLHDWQCERLRKVATAFGLAVPVR